MIIVTIGSFVDIVLISETPANEIHTRWIRLRESHLVYRMKDIADPYLLWKVVMILTPVLLVQIVDKKRRKYFGQLFILPLNGFQEYERFVCAKTGNSFCTHDQTKSISIS
jgi:hypothetical protein